MTPQNRKVVAPPKRSPKCPMPGPAPEGCSWDAERNMFVHADGTVYDKIAHRKAMRRKKRVEHQAAANAGDERANLILDRAAERSAKYQARVSSAAADSECSRHREATNLLGRKLRSTAWRQGRSVGGQKTRRRM